MRVDCVIGAVGDAAWLGSDCASAQAWNGSVNFAWSKDGCIHLPKFDNVSHACRFRQRVALTITDDMAAEGDETFSFVLIGGTNVRLNPDDKAVRTVAIKDDDATVETAAAPQFAVSPVRFAEDAGIANVEISYSGGPRTIAVSYETKDGTAAQPGDYASRSSTVGPALF